MWLALGETDSIEVQQMSTLNNFFWFYDIMYCLRYIQLDVTFLVKLFRTRSAYSLISHVLRPTRCTIKGNVALIEFMLLIHVLFMLSSVMIWYYGKPLRFKIHQEQLIYKHTIRSTKNPKSKNKPFLWHPLKFGHVLSNLDFLRVHCG